MKSFLVIILIAVVCFCCIIFFKPVRVAGCYRIAILTPVTHAALDEMIIGFKETIQKDLQCTFVVYNAHGDRTLLRNQAEHIVQDGTYDLMLAVSTQSSIIMKEVLSQRGCSLPVVCTAVDYPIQLGLIASLESSGNSFTTVIETQNYDKQLELLHTVLPHAKKLLLVYSPSVMIDNEKKLLAAACGKHGITLSAVPIYALNELAQKVGSHIVGNDCVIMLKDNTIASGIETLVMLCDRYRIPLYASDLNSFQAGATCAYGVYECQFGVEAAHKAYAILHDHKKPSDVASSGVNGCQFKVNKQALEKLGIFVTNGVSNV